MTSPIPASRSLAERYADLPLPPDATAVARLCADTFDALRDAETQIERLRAAVTHNRRIGIVLGIVMTVERVDEAEAARLLRNRGELLRWQLRSMAERIIAGPAEGEQCDGEAALATVTPLTRPVPAPQLRTAGS